MLESGRKGETSLLLIKLAQTLIAGSMFAIVWYSYYNERILTPFTGKGNYLFIAIFCVMEWSFAKLYGGFDLTTSQITELIYSHVVALLMTHCFTYVLIWLLIRANLPNPLPLLGSLIASSALSALWSYCAYQAANKLVPPKRTLIIYENQEAYKSALDIVLEYDNRFILVDKINAEKKLEEIVDEIEKSKAQAVMLCGMASSQRNDVLKYCVESNILAYVRPNIGDFLINGAEQFRMNNLPVMLCQRASPTSLYLAAKRFCDIVLAGVGIILASPIMLLTAISIKAYDGGPIMFRQKRLTLNRKEFYIHKFRSMRVGADDGGKGIVTLQNDDRITPVGKLIRACRIDELPQLLDVLDGNMSIVGPRPERVETIELYEKDMPEFGMRLQVKGGLTGYAQVYGKANTSPYDKLQMDLMYIAQQGFVTDLKIIFATIKILFMPESTEGFKQDLDTEEQNRG